MALVQWCCGFCGLLLPCVFLASVYHLSIFLEAPNPEFRVANSSPKKDDSGLSDRWQCKSIYDVISIRSMDTLP